MTSVVELPIEVRGFTAWLRERGQRVSGQPAQRRAPDLRQALKRPPGREVLLHVNDQALGPTEAERSQAAEALCAIPTPGAGQYATWRDVVWAAKAAGVDREAVRAWSQREAAAYDKGGDAEFERLWDGDREPSGGIGEGTLYHLARAAGWTPSSQAAAQRALRPAPSKGALLGVDGDCANAAADEAATSPTDMTLAGFFARQYGDVHKFDHGCQAWRSYIGGAFVLSDKGQEVEAAKAMASDIARLAAEAVRTDPDSSITKRKLECARRAQSANGIRNALSLAKSDPRVAVTFTEFDADPDLFNVANGVIHLPSGELRPHDPALRLHRQSPVPYDPAAECPAFLEFMLQIARDDTELVGYLQRFLGYALSGYVTEEKVQFWLGNGANGKSVLANVCRYLFGTYAASAPSAFLMQSRRDAGGATPELAMLPGVRLLMANEVEAGSRLSAQTLKVAVSTEHIAARPLYGNVFSFRPTHKTIVRGNHRPVIADDDEGIWRRIDLVPFELNLQPDQRDQGLEARLIAEAPGILRWMVEGFAKWRRDGLRQPRRVRDASLAYRKDSDVLGQWLDDVCDAGQGYEMPQAAAYGAFRQWCHDQGLRQVSKKSFTRGLRERGFGERRESTGQRKELYTGIRFKA